jgi:hypothetical protein
LAPTPTLAEQIVALGVAGVTIELAQKMVEGLGLDELNDIATLNETDLTGLGLKPVPARKLLAKFTQPAPVVQPATAAPTASNNGLTDAVIALVKANTKSTPITEIDEPSDLLAIVVDGTAEMSRRKQAATKLGTLDRRVVTDHERKVVDREATAELWGNPTSDDQFGENFLPIVAASVIFEETKDEEVKLDPYVLGKGRRVALSSKGFSQETKVNWTDVPIELQILLVWALRNKGKVPNRVVPDEENPIRIALAMKAENLPADWEVIRKVAATDRRGIKKIEGQLVCLRSELSAPPDLNTGAPTPAPNWPGHPDAAMEQLFEQLFPDAGVLRIFVSRGDRGSDLVASIRPNVVAVRDVANDLIIQVKRYRMVPGLLRRMFEEFPASRPEILATALRNGLRVEDIID